MLPGQQHDGLHEHSAVGPLPFLHLPIHGEEQRCRRAEKGVVPGEPGEARGLVFPGDAKGCVHAFPDLEAASFIGLGELRGINVVLRPFPPGRGFHLLLDLIHDGLLHGTGDRIHAPGLKIAAGGGPKGGGQNLP